MGSKKLAIALYRSLLRNAKVLDSHAEYKVQTFGGFPQVEWRGGAKWCDFFSTNASCVDTIRSEFRELKTENELDEALDEALEINKTVSERVHLLYCDEQDQQLLEFAEVPHTISFAEKYETDKSKQSTEAAEALNGALELIQSAAELLRSEDLEASDKARLAKAYYTESIKVFETADAHAFLGWHYYLDGEMEEAVSECERAIELDPTFGNAYNDLGLIRVKQGKKDEALTLFERAKTAPRNDVRAYACQNLAALHLEHNRVKPALHEYIEALHWMRPEETNRIMIRNTVSDMGNVLVTVAALQKSAE
ncbi:hypothetical protein BBJ28_00000859 [Nothophytophthora sp. Chile5]|nr:hypothetical protein BBJ28_00000859 [Nothophytophthora sp. Chile5]